MSDDVMPRLLAEFEVPGKPTQWQRPRVLARGSKKRVFVTEPRDRAHRQAIALIARTKLSRPTSAPVWLDLRFYLPLPKTAKVAARAAMLAGFKRPAKPDVDNLAKAVADALIGIAFSDDGQIAQLSCLKLYGVEPRTEVRLFALEQAFGIAGGAAAE